MLMQHEREFSDEMYHREKVALLADNFVAKERDLSVVLTIFTCYLSTLVGFR